MTNQVKYFKIYGQMRTGTNYISFLIKNNFLDTNVFMNIGGWKHGKLIEFPNNIELVNYVDSITKNNIEINKTIDLFKNNNVNFLVIIKNPYMWINSISVYKNKEITSEFIIENISIWNEIYSNYKYYIECDKAYLVKYDTLLKETNEVLDKIMNKFNLTKKNQEYILENNVLHANNDSNIGKTKRIIFDKNKYISPNITNYLSNDIIRNINENIDVSLMKFYDYELVIV
jgi:hypothetical protein